MKHADVEAKMQNCLNRLGVRLTVSWTPDASRDKHGLIELSSGTLSVFDEEEDQAWSTFFHEVCEFKLDEVLRHYRNVINGLIEIIEKSCYRKKEEFIEFLPSALKEIESSHQARSSE
jgi:hypothetical protein